MKQGLTFVMENIVKSEEREGFIGEIKNYRLQLPTLFNTTAKTMMKTSHPRKHSIYMFITSYLFIYLHVYNFILLFYFVYIGIWWDFCGDCIPNVQKYAVRILG
ncbi:hypothetical protein Droror1_Dr00012276 [Drosera rotundifolia]